MLRDVVVLIGSGAGSYLWLCAIVSPLATALRSLGRHGADRTAWTAFGLAAAAGALWTALAAGAIVLGVMMESEAAWRGVTLGNIMWACQMVAFARAPRIGPTFETGSALALVAFVREDPWTLSRVERLYRAHAVADVAETALVSGPARRVAA